MSVALCEANQLLLVSCQFTFGVVAEWSKVLIALPLPLMVSSTLALGTYQLRFISSVFHIIFSFIHFISFDTLGPVGGAHTQTSSIQAHSHSQHTLHSVYTGNMYLFSLWIANHILIKRRARKQPQMAIFASAIVWLCVPSSQSNVNILVLNWRYESLIANIFYETISIFCCFHL